MPDKQRQWQQALKFAQGQYIISMDGDLQNDPADIPKLLEKLEEGYDLVCGWRKERQDKFFNAACPLYRRELDNWQGDGGSLYTTMDARSKHTEPRLSNRSPLYGEMHRFIPAMSTVVGARIAEIVVTHHPRRFGKKQVRAW